MKRSARRSLHLERTRCIAVLKAANFKIYADGATTIMLIGIGIIPRALERRAM